MLGCLLILGIENAILPCLVIFFVYLCRNIALQAAGSFYLVKRFCNSQHCFQCHHKPLGGRYWEWLFCVEV